MPPLHQIQVEMPVPAVATAARADASPFPAPPGGGGGVADVFDLLVNLARGADEPDGAAKGDLPGQEPQASEEPSGASAKDEQISSRPDDAGALAIPDPANPVPPIPVPVIAPVAQLAGATPEAQPHRALPASIETGRFQDGADPAELLVKTEGAPPAPQANPPEAPARGEAAEPGLAREPVESRGGTPTTMRDALSLSRAEVKPALPGARSEAQVSPASSQIAPEGAGPPPVPAASAPPPAPAPQALAAATAEKPAGAKASVQPGPRDGSGTPAASRSDPAASKPAAALGAQDAGDLAPDFPVLLAEAEGEAAPAPAEGESRETLAAGPASAGSVAASGSAREAGAAAAGSVAHLAAQIVRRLEGRATRFDLQLDPAGLGQVRVALEITARGRMAAALLFERPESAEAFRARASELRAALEEAGFDLADASLSFETAGRGFAGGGRDEDAHPSAGARAFDLAAAGADQADAATAAPRNRSVRGLDIRI